MKKLISVLSLSALLLASCSKSSSPTSNNNNNNNAGANQVVATVGSTAITFKTLAHSGGSYTQIAGISSLSFAIAGTDSATGSTLTIGGGGFVGTGTYDIGLEHGHGTTSDYAFALDYTKKGSGSGSTEYRSDANNSVKVGTIDITSVSATGAQGTFSATLPQINPSGTSNTVAITNGSFNVTF
ncbi:MAG: hypothetical protein ACHQM6_04720 [Candidatus Kapaibacterium sp.]